MSNDKILIDRAVVERAYQVAANEDKHDLMQALDVAIAASPAVQEGNASAYLTLRVVELEQKWEALNDACLAKDRRITELTPSL